MLLKTQRLSIRRFQEKDLPAYMRYHNDADWMRYHNFKNLDETSYRAELLTDRPFERGWHFAICDQTDALIGDVFLLYEDPMIWLGYAIDRSHARQGYAYEALRALIFELSAQGVTLIKAEVHPENTASLRLLKKLGFCDEGSYYYLECSPNQLRNFD